MNINLTPYLLLNGNAKEAIDFYTHVFNAKVLSIDYLKEWPDELDEPIPSEYKENVMHAHIIIGQSELMLADVLPKQEYRQGNSINIMVDVKKTIDAKQLYEQLLENGKEIMSLQDTGFSPATGQVRDQFGIEWQIVTEHPDMKKED